MRVDVVTLFPELVRAPLSGSIVGRALAQERFELGCVDIRPFGLGRHHQVDDTPYGGGPGMVMRVDVVEAAIASVRRPSSRVLLTSASGRRITQADIVRWAALDHLVVVCGHYEGIDDRVGSVVDEEVCLADFVMTGGEITAIAIVDAVVRLLPGVLGNEASPVVESFANGRLEAPQFTRPRSWRGLDVPEVLLGGHHAQIEAWRREEGERRTRERRPELLGFDGPQGSE